MLSMRSLAVLTARRGSESTARPIRLRESRIADASVSAFSATDGIRGLVPVVAGIQVVCIP